MERTSQTPTPAPATLTSQIPGTSKPPMGAEDAVMEKEGDIEVGKEQGEKENTGNGEVKENEEVEVGLKEQVTENAPQGDTKFSRLQRLNPTNPLRIIIQGGSRAPRRSPAQPLSTANQTPTPNQTQTQTQTPTPTPQQSLTTLNSRVYTNRISLFLFLLHAVIAVGLIGFLVFKAIQGLLQGGKIKRSEKRILRYWLPQVEVSAIISITLAFAWQKAVREWPEFMVNFILWSSFATSLSAGILLLCFQMPSTAGLGVALVAFSIGNGLYACWVTQRVRFYAKVFVKSLEPVSKFPDINQPIYWMIAVGFMWITLWVFAVIGAMNFYLPPLIILLLVLSLLWTAEVMRNVANLTASRVIALYYLRGMQCSTEFCFQRAISRNLGSACLGSLFVPTIEALRIVARALNLLEGEDEFMFSCAHCCLRVMETIFRYGNGWAYVQIAAYGKGFVEASQTTWDLFEKRGMEPIVDSDITSTVCFLTGVCSGSICIIAVGSWTFAVSKSFTATVSLLAFIIGYLMTRIGMALPHACVGCYYVCYAENPENRLFDKTIPDRIDLIRSGRDIIVPTPRIPRRFAT